MSVAHESFTGTAEMLLPPLHQPMPIFLQWLRSYCEARLWSNPLQYRPPMRLLLQLGLTLQLKMLKILGEHIDLHDMLRAAFKFVRTRILRYARRPDRLLWHVSLVQPGRQCIVRRKAFGYSLPCLNTVAANLAASAIILASSSVSPVSSDPHDQSVWFHRLSVPHVHSCLFRWFHHCCVQQCGASTRITSSRKQLNGTPASASKSRHADLWEDLKKWEDEINDFFKPEETEATKGKKIEKDGKKWKASMQLQRTPMSLPCVRSRSFTKDQTDSDLMADTDKAPSLPAGQGIQGFSEELTLPAEQGVHQGSDCLRYAGKH